MKRQHCREYGRHYTIVGDILDKSIFSFLKPCFILVFLISIPISSVQSVGAKCACSLNSQDGSAAESISSTYGWMNQLESFDARYNSGSGWNSAYVIERYGLSSFSPFGSYSQYNPGNTYGLYGSATTYGGYGLGSFSSYGSYSQYNPATIYELYGIATPFSKYGGLDRYSTSGSFNQYNQYNQYNQGNVYGLYGSSATYGSYGLGNFSSANYYSQYNLGTTNGFSVAAYSYGNYYSWGIPVVSDKPKSAEPQPVEPTVYINLQIDADISPGADNTQGLVTITDELKRRQITATIFVTGEFANQAQMLITNLYQDGFEIALHGYYTGEQLATMDYTEQSAKLTQAKKAVEGCLPCGTYKSVIGFRPQYFSQDENTYHILDELGIKYNCGFKVGQHPYVEGHKNDTWPFAMEGHDFCVLPVSKATYHETLVYACDIGMAAGKMLPSAAWSELLSDTLDRAIATKEPIVILFHNWYTGLDVSPEEGTSGYWQPFVDFLDEAEEKGAEFITTQKLIEDYCK
ncbi:MAG: polysaccharide deacetylase family protein [bacterium]